MKLTPSPFPTQHSITQHIFYQSMSVISPVYAPCFLSLMDADAPRIHLHKSRQPASLLSWFYKVSLKGVS